MGTTKESTPKTRTTIPINDKGRIDLLVASSSSRLKRIGRIGLNFSCPSIHERFQQQLLQKASRKMPTVDA
jgi:hypothetical protein